MHPARRLLLGTPLLMLVFLLASWSSAQFPEDPHPIQLSPAAEAKLTALGELAELPAETWRVHDGDLAHGEAVGLDDTAWPQVSHSYVGTTGAMWFRRTITVPASLHGYDLTGAKVWFGFDIWAEGPVPLIVYFNGRRVAMGEALEPVVLFEHATPGDTIEVAVKALDSADEKHFAGAHLTIDFPPGRPSPETIRLEVVSAENLLPALTRDGPERQRKRDMLEAAVAAVAMDALQRKDQAAFDRSLQHAQTQLELLRPLLSTASFHLTGDAHIDAAWVWPWTETVDVVHRTFGTALQLMREYPGYTFSQSAAAYYEWMADKYPAMNREIAARVKQGRWEAVGGMWVEPDLNLPDGESIVRQLLLGTRFFQQQFGTNVHVGWNVDSFGYTWQLPQIYKKSGIDYFVTQKMDWNETNRLPLKLFYWESPDGSQVLTYFPHNYTNFIEPVRMAEDFNVARRENPGLPSMMHLYGIGDHGGGPTRSMLDAAEAWMQPGKVFPPEHFGTAESYLRAMEGKVDRTHAPIWNYAALAAGKGTLAEPPAGKIAVPIWKDELYLEYTRGVYTSQARQKRNMRESETEMLDAEKWSALAWLQAGAAYPAVTLNDAWKKVLFNQFHDIAAGSSIGVVYKDAQRDYDAVRLAAADATMRARSSLASQIDTRPNGDSEEPVVVWNSLAWQRSGIAKVDVELPGGESAIEMVDAQGRVLPSQPSPEQAVLPRHTVLFLADDVPALGYRVFFARPARQAPPPASALKTSEQAGFISLENEKLSVSIDKASGCILHLVQKPGSFDSIAPGGCGGQLQAFVDRPAAYDAWNIDPGTLDHPMPLPPLESVTLTEQGPLRATVRTVFHWRSSTFVQEISLTAGLDHLDIANQVQWHEQHTLLKAAFPLAAYGPAATYEIPYGTIARPTTRNNSWEDAKFEVPALRWADLGDQQHGVSLLNDSKYGYDAKGNVLRLTLLRSPTAPDPHADQGEQRFAYSLYPHTATWRESPSMRRGYEFNSALQAEQTSIHPGTLPAAMSFVSLAPATLTLTAVKKTEDGDGLLLRFYEWAGKAGTATLHLPGGIASARLTNLMEVPDADTLPIITDSVYIPYQPFFIVTLRVDYRAKQNERNAEARGMAGTPLQK
jgi:alpha-mannosidase